MVKEIAGLGWTTSEKTKEVIVVTVVGEVEVEVGAVVAVALRVVAEAETVGGVGEVAGYVSFDIQHSNSLNLISPPASRSPVFLALSTTATPSLPIWITVRRTQFSLTTATTVPSAFPYTAEI